MAEEWDDDEDGTPPHADADEPERGGIRTSDRTAPGERRWTALTPPKIATCISSQRLSVLSRVGCLVCLGPHPCFHVLTTSPRHLDSDKPCFCFCDGLKKS